MTFENELTYSVANCTYFVSKIECTVHIGILAIVSQAVSLFSNGRDLSAKYNLKVKE